MKVTVRMYRHGLGDCFLLMFDRPDRPFYMMIDCGVLQNLQGAPERLAEVVRDINRETGGDGPKGGELDLFVMTHEHWDHISGFCYSGSSKVLEKMKIKQVWLSWL